MACRIVVLISGSGSNLQALIDHLDPAHGQIVLVVSNRADAYGLQRAAKAGIETQVLDHNIYASREAFDQAMMARLDSYSPDLLILAGFMRILTPAFVNHYHGRLLNIHPSLLPKYKGLNTHQRALNAGEAEHGATVHFVTEELDGGPLIVQAPVPIVSGDTSATLAARVQQSEHLLYPQAMNWFASGRLRLIDNRACLDGKPVGPVGTRLENMETDMRGMTDV
ncbi:MAG TPA: phosphoribosylglycinamide formyltransferase [Pseudomonas xinjiangensis]|uniref:Phosphoribosylglycinamide formyltransferase n=2 Tax=root TaxID=1 RepID=A0A7V1BNW0_9GAMM|nr:phosphoribosylglycinamide formyltransferase [Halopseudomonas xinjiangensis]HEC47972.1 phosphoribosylglycinamide formyltransferase [Halopseudomonas xinjiangensis]